MGSSVRLQTLTCQARLPQLDCAWSSSRDLVLMKIYAIYNMTAGQTIPN